MKRFNVVADEDSLRADFAAGDRFSIAVTTPEGEADMLWILPSDEQPPANHDMLVGTTDEGDTVNIHLHDQPAVAIIGGGVIAE